MGYRTRDEIFASILRSAAKNKEGTRFTRIMYDSFLSYTQISQYLNEVIRFGLLINEPDVTKYKITEKGLRFLDLLEKMDNLLSH
ncbi:MAG TPA: winged helix-turn-helix domain-containing protein [Nitrososphaeraceae archaeon]|jgi:predicted transcriptional regulator